ncbi:MAG: phosphatidylglycerol lysyltransferase domain-containing protein [Acidobacteriota bacterium]
MRRAVRHAGVLRHGAEFAEGVGLWILSHGASLWPALALVAVLGLSWSTLRTVHIQAVRAALGALDSPWVAATCAFTAFNVMVMGLYDVVAFRQTRSPALERWRYGMAAFAWSNFLTVGPLAGPAIRLWLYSTTIDRAADIQGGIVATTMAFTAGLGGWTVAVTIAAHTHSGLAVTGLIALASTWLIVGTVRWCLTRWSTMWRQTMSARTWEMTLVGWLDWLLAAAAFLAAVRAGRGPVLVQPSLSVFFYGQIVGLASLAPGGLGSADAFWIDRLPAAPPVSAAIVALFRLVYYILPWAAASLTLLSWANRRAAGRVVMARRLIGLLIGAGGVLMMLSSATPALHARLLTLERFVPLPLVEFGQVAAAMSGLLLLTLALKLARGYRTAFRATMVLLGAGAISALFKGIDWEEALILGGLAVAAASNAAIFDRDSRGDWIESTDIVLAAAAVGGFFVVGILTQRLGFDAFDRWMHLGYRLEASRFARSTMALALAVSAGAVYLALRAPSRFARPSPADINKALELHAIIGGSSTPLMMANGDKSIFIDGERGLCAYRIIGPYLVVFADPVVRAGDRGAFLTALFEFAAEADRRPLFYQLSAEWIPALHDRGYRFFKLGEEAQLPLSRVTADGTPIRLFGQILRRATRDRVRFRVMPPYEVARRLDELQAISNDWLASRSVVERQFSIGFFDRDYIGRFPCAVVETLDGTTLLAFANLLQGPRRVEMSVDLMRYRRDGPKVMDFLFVSLFLHAKKLGYQRFNLGMAPLASVGAVKGAHPRERLARLVFQHGEHFYRLRGLRFFKQKFEPDWEPRYVSYQTAWEFPIAIAYVSALIAGGWTRVFRSGVKASSSSTPTPQGRVPAEAAADP